MKIEIKRRQFLKAAGVYGASAILGRHVLEEFIPWALQTDSTPLLSPERGIDLYVNSLYQKKEVYTLAKTLHAKFYETTPLARPTTKDFYTYAYNHCHNLTTAIQATTICLFPTGKLGLKIHDYPDQVPSVLPAQVDYSKYSREEVEYVLKGYDRTSHFASHLLLTYEYITSRQNGTNSYKEIPRIFRKTLPVLNNPILEAKILSNTVGLAYEAITTNQKDEHHNTGHANGFADPFVTLDLQANMLGANAGIQASQLKTSSEIRSWLTTLP